MKPKKKELPMDTTALYISEISSSQNYHNDENMQLDPHRIKVCCRKLKINSLIY